MFLRHSVKQTTPTTPADLPALRAFGTIVPALAPSVGVTGSEHQASVTAPPDARSVQVVSSLAFVLGGQSATHLRSHRRTSELIEVSCAIAFAFAWSFNPCGKVRVILTFLAIFCPLLITRSVYHYYTTAIRLVNCFLLSSPPRSPPPPRARSSFRVRHPTATAPGPNPAPGSGHRSGRCWWQ